MRRAAPLRPAVLIVLALMLLGKSGVRSQEAYLPPTTFHSAVDLVTVSATVENLDGSFSDGLTASDFRVAENGVPQTIAFFGVDDIPTDLVLLIDSSGSMTRRLPAVKHAAGTLIEALSPRDRATVVTFGSVVRPLVPLTENRAALTAAIDRVAAGGTTSLYDAIYVALRTFSTPSAQVRRRALVVLSDGQDTASLMSYESVLQLVHQTGMVIYTVMLRDLSTERNIRATTAAYEMRALATETGGRFLVADNGHLDPIYQSIARELAHQYSIGYVSTRPPGRNEFARISVLVARTDVTVRARRGYLVSPGWSSPR